MPETSGRCNGHGVIPNDAGEAVIRLVRNFGGGQADV